LILKILKNSHQNEINKSIKTKILSSNFNELPKDKSFGRSRIWFLVEIILAKIYLFRGRIIDYRGALPLKPRCLIPQKMWYLAKFPSAEKNPMRSKKIWIIHSTIILNRWHIYYLKLYNINQSTMVKLKKPNEKVH
jgi:hypothetical protein